MKKVLITGILGQIGSYLADLYLENDYEVAGTIRRSGIDHFQNIEHIKDRVKLFPADITDISSLLYTFNVCKPDIVINCAAQSEVGTSFSNPCTTFDITGKGVLNLLEVIRQFYPKTKFLQFSSSEMMGSSFSLINGEKYQDENTALHPMSPYAVAKLAGHHMVKVYRESYGLFASNIVAFNNESPRRKDYFVTRKITKWIGEFINWIQESDNGLNEQGFFADHPDNNRIYINPFSNEPNFPKLALGNIDSVRSWTHTKDTARAAKLILEYKDPEDFCIGSPECYSVRDFLETSFSLCGLDWKDYVYQDPQFMRPNDLTFLRPYPQKAKDLLGWEQEISFRDLVKEMVEYDVQKAKEK